MTDPASTGEGGQPDATGPGRRELGPPLIVAGLALLAAVIFVVQNSERVEARFLFFNGEPRLWVVIVASMLLGALLGQAVPYIVRRRRRRRSEPQGGTTGGAGQG